MDLKKEGLNSHKALTNNSRLEEEYENNEIRDADISYEEYDHDMDVINSNDLLNGMEETQENLILVNKS